MEVLLVNGCQVRDHEYFELLPRWFRRQIVRGVYYAKQAIKDNREFTHVVLHDTEHDKSSSASHQNVLDFIDWVKQHHPSVKVIVLTILQPHDFPPQYTHCTTTSVVNFKAGPRTYLA